MEILRTLLFSENATFSQIKPEGMENNEFNFHLKEVQKRKWVEKIEDGYTLTLQGKEYANMMDTDKKRMIKQAKVGALSACVRQKLGKEDRYLVYTRQKQPFFGGQGWMSGKIEFGETTLAASQREMREETGLEGTPTLVAIEHYLVKDSKTNEIVEDKILFMHKYINPTGELVTGNEGKYEWVKESDLESYITKPFDSKEAFLGSIRTLKEFNGQVKYIEIVQETDEF